MAFYALTQPAMRLWKIVHSLESHLLISLLVAADISLTISLWRILKAPRQAESQMVANWMQ